MPKPRRIVPDCSVLVPAFFPELLRLGDRIVNLTHLSSPVLAGIGSGEVTAFAPDLLVKEFLDYAHRRLQERSAEAQHIEAQILRFLQLKVKYVPAIDLAERSWELRTHHGVSPPDSWYLACANYYDAEYWLSHRHKDRIAEAAARVHNKVFILTEQRFATGRRS